MNVRLTGLASVPEKLPIRYGVTLTLFAAVKRTRAGLAQSVWWFSYGLDDRGPILDGGRDSFSSPSRPDRPWSPPSLLL